VNATPAKLPAIPAARTVTLDDEEEEVALEVKAEAEVEAEVEAECKVEVGAVSVFAGGVEGGGEVVLAIEGSWLVVATPLLVTLKVLGGMAGAVE